MFKKFLVLMLALALTATYPSMVFADDNEVQTTDNEENEEEDEVGKGTLKPWKEKRASIMAERRTTQNEFSKLGMQLEDLEKQLEETEETDTDKIAELKTKIEDIKTEMGALKDEISLKIEGMKALMKERYTEEDLENLEKVGQSLKESTDAVLPVENILTEKDVKFDTPPVIKYGRTLIPLRAVVEGMGAEVTYDAENHIVTIVKDADTEKEIKIELNLHDDTVKVNGGEPEAIDVPAEVMNNRTMVPLRFIAEQLGLKVQWDQDTQTVTIEE